MKKKISGRLSKSPPRGWPAGKEWVEIERRLAKSKPSRVLSVDASAVDRTKYELCAHFVRYCQEEKLTQRELAAILGVSEARVSEIVHYRFGRFTIDKLLALLSAIRPNLKVKIA